MKKVLVTGASGQLGLSILDVHKDYPHLAFEFKNRAELYITNSNQVNTIFTLNNYD